MVKQTRPRVRLTGQAFENPLRDPRRLARQQTHMRDGRRAGEVRQIGRNQRDRAALKHADHDHHIAARVLDRRRAPLRPLVRAHHKTVQLKPHRAIIAAAGDKPNGERPGSSPAREPEPPAAG